MRSLFAWAVLLAAVFPAHAENPTQVYAAFGRAVESSKDRAPKVANILRSARSQFEELARGVALPEGTAYARVFADYRRDLDWMAERPEQSLLLARDLLEDISLKNRFLAAGHGFAARNKFLVKLRVTAYGESGQPLLGLRVAANYRRHAAAEPAAFPFDKPTSPSTEEWLAPGQYYLRFLRDGALVHVQDVVVGMKGSETELLEVRIKPPTRK